MTQLSRRSLAGAGLGLPLLAAPRRARAAGLRMLCSNALRSSASELAAGFTRASGHAVTADYQPVARLNERILAGEAFDVAVLTPALLEGLVRAGKLADEPPRALARAGVGLAVRRGMPKPDISTVEGFRQALLAAPSVAHSTAGQSNLVLQAALERLGIAAEVRAKARPVPNGPTAALLASGEAALAVQQIPELLSVPEAELVGPFPPELQRWTSFSAGLSAAATDPVAARAWIAWLASPEAAALYRRKGLEPAA